MVSLLGMRLCDLLEHEKEKGRLGTVQVVLPQAIGNETVLLEYKGKGVQNSLSRVQHVAYNQS